MDVNPVRSFSTRLIAVIHRFEDALLAFLLMAMIALAATQIILRNVFEVSLVWADPLLRIMVLWAALIGAVTASRDNKHITIDVLTRLMNNKARQIARIITSVFTAAVTGTIAYHASRFVIMEYETGNLVLGMPAWIFEAIIPMAFALMGLRYSIQFVKHVQTLFMPGKST